MHGDARFIGMFALIPMTTLLTISFFVMVVLRKLESESLKSFGRIVVLLLWGCAVLVYSAGIYILATGHYPMKYTLSSMYRFHSMSGRHCMSMMGQDKCAGMKQVISEAIAKKAVKK